MNLWVRSVVSPDQFPSAVRRRVACDTDAFKGSLLTHFDKTIHWVQSCKTASHCIIDARIGEMRVRGAVFNCEPRESASNDAY